MCTVNPATPCNRSRGGRTWGSTEPLPLRPGALQARQYPLPNAFSLELRDGAQDVHLQLAGGRCCVDALRQADERNPERLQLVEQRNQVLQIATESIEPPAD